MGKMIHPLTCSNSSSSEFRSYPHEEYCNVYHACESASDNMRQCPHQLFWDNEQQKCDWSDKVHCSKRTLVALSMETNTFCLERSDGFFIDPHCKSFGLFVFFLANEILLLTNRL